MTLLKIGRTVNMINLVPKLPYISWHDNHRHFNQPGGVEQYKLLAYISSQLPDGTTVIDVGTYLGCSALALSYNEKVNVVTYDAVDNIPNDKTTIKSIPNINMILSDYKDHIQSFIDKPIIVLDIERHDGIQEKIIVQRLIDAGYKGIIICDDININADMKAFWEWVPIKKHDVSKYGHWTGTGIIVFDPAHIDVVIE